MKKIFNGAKCKVSSLKQAIGARLEEFLTEDKQNMEQINSAVSDESKQRDLILEDEEEDFLDDGDSLINSLAQSVGTIVSPQWRVDGI